MSERALDAVGPADVVSYLSSLAARARALDDAALQVRRFRVGGIGVIARFSDRDRADLYASRLPITGAKGNDPVARIDVLETDALSWPPPAVVRFPDGDRDLFDRLLADNGFRAVPPDRSHLWTLHDRRNNHIVQIGRSPADDPPWDAGAPLRIPLHWIMADDSRRLIHAATVGDGNRAALIVGPGGAGKSGTTLAAISQGMRTVGDDYVSVALDNRPEASLTYRLMKQDKAGIARIPELAARVGDATTNWQGKLEFDPEAAYPGSLSDTQSLDAILIAERSDAPRTSIEPTSATHAFGALARSTLQQFPDERASGFHFCQRLVRAVPCHRLVLSTDVDDIVSALRGFLKEEAT